MHVFIGQSFYLFQNFSLHKKIQLVFLNAPNDIFFTLFKLVTISEVIKTYWRGEFEFRSFSVSLFKELTGYQLSCLKHKSW